MMQIHAHPCVSHARIESQLTHIQYMQPNYESGYVNCANKAHCSHQPMATQ